MVSRVEVCVYLARILKKENDPPDGLPSNPEHDKCREKFKQPFREFLPCFRQREQISV